MALWSWDPTSRRYRITPEGAEALGQKPGTFVGESKMLQFREAVIAHSKERTNALAKQLANGDINLNQWILGMRQEVKDSFINQYMLAHGGRNSMTQADWGKVGQMVKTQYQHLDQFAADIAIGRYTEAGVAARARMYAESSSQAFEQAKVAARGMPELPTVPGAGATRCLSNCRCFLKIDEKDDAWNVYWSLSASEHCADCLQLNSTWNPLVIPKSMASTRSVVIEQLREQPGYHEHALA